MHTFKKIYAEVMKLNLFFCPPLFRKRAIKPTHHVLLTRYTSFLSRFNFRTGKGGKGMLAITVQFGHQGCRANTFYATIHFFVKKSHLPVPFTNILAWKQINNMIGLRISSD